MSVPVAGSSGTVAQAVMTVTLPGPVAISPAAVTTVQTSGIVASSVPVTATSATAVQALATIPQPGPVAISPAVGVTVRALVATSPPVAIAASAATAIQALTTVGTGAVVAPSQSYNTAPIPADTSSSFTGRLLDRMRPWMTPAHQIYLSALGQMFEQVSQIVQDQETDGDPGFVPGWGVLLDPDLCPTEFLPYLGQFVGVANLVGVPDAQARALIKAQPKHRRGTPRSFIDSAKSTLTGTQTVLLTERYQGDPYQMQVVTYVGETPDKTRTLTALLQVKPAGILLTYQTLSGQRWQDVLALGTWNQMQAQYGTWNAVRNALPGS